MRWLCHCLFFDLATVFGSGHEEELVWGENVAHAVMENPWKPDYDSVSCWGKTRSWAHWIQDSTAFDSFVMLMVGLNCGLMTLERPSIEPDSEEAELFFLFDIIFNVQQHARIRDDALKFCVACHLVFSC